MAGRWRGGGVAALATHAPTAQTALAALALAWPSTLEETRLATVRTVAAEGLGLSPLPPPPSGPRALPIPEPELGVMAFAEQFAVDVTALDPAQVEAWRELIGDPDAVHAATVAAFAADYVPRARAALDVLFGEGTWSDPPPDRTEHIVPVLDELVREVALLGRLGPVTGELVRLRVATHHGSRVGLRRRSLAALDAGADEETLAEVDHYRSSSLPAAQRAALALTDGIVWTPADIRAQDVRLVHEHLTPAAAVEVVLNVLAHAADKVAVALGEDVPAESEPRFFELDDEGVVRLV